MAKKTNAVEESQAYNKRWVEGGGKLTSFQCHHCEHTIETPRPTDDLCIHRGKGGFYWDSLFNCPYCGGPQFVKKYTNGDVSVFVPEEDPV